MIQGQISTIVIPRISFTLKFDQVDMHGAYVFSVDPNFHDLPGKLHSEVKRRLKEEAVEMTRGEFVVGIQFFPGHKVVGGKDYIFVAIGI